MLTIEVTYKLDSEKPRESSMVVQIIKSILSILTDGYTQTTDSAIRPTQYVFSSQVSEETIAKLREKISRIPENLRNGITIINK